MRIIARLNIGGPAIHAVLLSSCLDRNRFETLLVTGEKEPREGDMSYLARRARIEAVVIPQMRRSLNPLLDLIAFFKICGLISRFRPQILHTHTAKAGTLGRLAALTINLWRALTLSPFIRTVHTFHGHVLSDYFNPIQTAFFRTLERLLAAGTDRLVTVSETVKQDLLRLKISSGKRLSVIRLGFDLEPFLSLEPARCATRPRVGIVGRLVPIKNHRMFLDAVTLLETDAQAHCDFEIIGDGELRESLQSYAQQKGIAAHLEFRGWQQDLPAVYRNLDIVALTSLNEGTPVSIIEALASGRAVVATQVGGVSDLLGAARSGFEDNAGFKVCQRGILIRSGDARGLFEALRFLCAHPQLWPALTEAGRIFARENFGKERLVGEIERLYGELLKHRHMTPDT